MKIYAIAKHSPVLSDKIINYYLKEESANRFFKKIIKTSLGIVLKQFM